MKKAARTSKKPVALLELRRVVAFDVASELPDTAPLRFRVEIWKESGKRSFRVRVWRAEHFRLQIFGDTTVLTHSDEAVLVADGMLRWSDVRASTERGALQQVLSMLAQYVPVPQIAARSRGQKPRRVLR